MDLFYFDPEDDICVNNVLSCTIQFYKLLNLQKTYRNIAIEASSLSQI